MGLTAGNQEPKSVAPHGYHNVEEYHFYKSLSKRELFVILRERALSSTIPPHKDNWTDDATKELTLLHKYGIK